MLFRIAIASLLSAACQAEPKTLTPAQFTAAVVAAAYEKDPDLDIKVVGDLQIAGVMQGTEAAANLAYSYSQYLGDTSLLDTILANWAITLTHSQVTGGDISERLVFVSRHVDYLNVPGGDTTIARPIGGDQIAVLMLDSPSSLTMVAQATIDEAGISNEDAWGLAAENLLVRLGATTWDQIGRDMPYAMGAQSGLATGLLAHPDQCGTGKNEMGDGRIVLVADRDNLLSTIAGDAESERMFWAFAAPLLGTGALLSDTPLKCVNRQWVTVDPPS